jgi:hypothetical protein
MTGKQLRSLLIAEQLKHSIDCRQRRLPPWL